MPAFLLLVWLILLSGAPQLSAQPSPPSLRCIAVESNGTISLTWLAPPDTGLLFGGYHIYSSNFANGPFTAVDSIFNYATLTTNIATVNANNATLFFYIRTREGCCANYSLSSDTLRSMRMIVTPLSNEHVRLNWNRIHIPPLPTTLSTFALSKELTPGVFTAFRNTLDTTILDTNYFCNKFINYKLTQGDLSGCVSESSIDGELFRDTKGPAKPLIDTVSVDPLTGQVIITWYPDSSSDTQGYVIYQFNGISYDSIGSAIGINTLSFLNTLSNAENISETYNVAAYDSCKNLSSLADNHKTIFLSSSFVKCDALVTLDWTSYQNMNGGLSRYEIWMSENAGPWVRESFVPSNVLSYEKILTNPGATYEFFIRAVSSSGKTASSNKENILADIFQQPQYLYIRSASVMGSSVKIRCHVDPVADIKSYILYGSSSISGPFSIVEIISYTANTEVIFNDLISGADKMQRFYKITARDSCGKEFVTSNIVGTVFLIAQGGNDYSSELMWLPYMGWQNQAGSYHIYRVINSSTAATPFVSFSGDTLFYTDNIADANVGDENICYIIMAKEDSVNSFGFSDSAFSNIACAPQAPGVFIPNAFTPGGKNPVFKPFLIFDDPTSYSLKIFNRWGQNVFESANPEKGWNGQYNETDAGTGIYAYLLVFKGLNKKEIRKMGTVVLIR